MTNLTLRGVKGTPLTNDEMDSNFSSLNDFKVEQTDSTGSALIPSGTTAQRDGSPSAGMFRYNTELGQFEGYTTDWGLIGGGGLDSADLTNGTFTGKVIFDSAEFSGDLIVDTNTLFVDATNNKVLIGTAVSATTDTLQVNGTAIVGNTSLVESWIDIGRNAASGGSRGALYLYGSPTGYSTGGTIYFYNAVDHDSNNSFYRAKTSGEDWVLELADGSDILTYDYSASQWLMPQSGGLDVTGNITAGGLTVDTDTLHVDAADNRVGIGTTAPDERLHIRGSTSAKIWIDDAANGRTDFNNDATKAGILLTAGGMNSGSKYTPAITFGSTDPQFTTTNPKTLAGIVGVARQTYDSDTDGRMAIDFFTSTNGSALDSAIQRMRIDHNGDIAFYNDVASAEFYWDASVGSLGIGTIEPASKLHVADGDIQLDEFVINSQTATTTATTQVAIATFSATTYGSAEVVITAKDGSNRHITKLLIVHNGTTASATEFGTVVTSSNLAAYDVDISGGNVRVLATPASTNSTVFNLALTLIDA